MTYRSLCCAVLASVASAGSAAAAGPDYLVFGAGATDIIRQERTAGDLRFEYRSGLSLLPFFEQYVQVKPWIGGELATRGSAWGGGGILLDIPIAGGFVVSPSFGVGAYGRSHGKNLGSVVEFRSQFEAGYMFQDGTRITAAFSHTSNAGITRHNPGTEAVTINYALPIGSLFGR